MKINKIDFKGCLYFEDVNLHIYDNGDRQITTAKIFYENNSDPYDIEAEMEVDKKKYEAMKWYNKTFCNVSNQ